MIVIVDYGLGNLMSVQNMIAKIGYQSVISSNEDEIRLASKIILPGVGSFDDGVENIEKKGLRKILVRKALKNKTPFLGICLGMHLMTLGSEEGSLNGLGIIEGYARRLPNNFNDIKLLVPHIGWNLIKKTKQNPIIDNFDDKCRFYFVHAYHVELNNPNHILLKTNYGIEFISGFVKDNIVGVQFHPEKSHSFGKQLMKNFIENF